VSKLDHMLEPEAPSVRRLEIITGTGRRRQFSDDDKARIVEETLAPGAVVSEAARRHGLTPQQVFTWRRQARQMQLTGGDREASVPTFVPAVVESTRADPASLPAPVPKNRIRKQGRRTDGLAGIIEVSIAGVTVRVGRGADAKSLTAVIAALKAGS
jgi:transposase